MIFLLKRINHYIRVKYELKIREIEICIKIGSLLINGEYIPRIEQSFHEKGNS